MRELIVEKYKNPTYILSDGTKVWENRLTGGGDKNKPAKIFSDGIAVYYDRELKASYKNILSHEEQIEGLISEFNFTKVQHVMGFLDWGYYSLPAPPSIGELQKTARELLNHVNDCALKDNSNYDYYYYASGGFWAEYFKESNSFRLKFVLEGGETL